MRISIFGAKPYATRNRSRFGFPLEEVEAREAQQQAQGENAKRVPTFPAKFLGGSSEWKGVQLQGTEGEGKSRAGTRVKGVGEVSNVHWGE